MMSKLPTGEKLLEEAEKYGVAISGEGIVINPIVAGAADKATNLARCKSSCRQLLDSDG